MYQEKTGYSAKLADPRWQKKRLEILERDGWECQDWLCRTKTKELHVHHKYYLPNKKPWEYPNDCYITLCHKCHEEEENGLIVASKDVIQSLKMAGADAFVLRLLASYFKRADSGDAFYLVENILHLILLKQNGIDIYQELNDRTYSILEKEEQINDLNSPSNI